jgi:hypothetical protein
VRTARAASTTARRLTASRARPQRCAPNSLADRLQRLAGERLQGPAVNVLDIEVCISRRGARCHMPTLTRHVRAQRKRIVPLEGAELEMHLAQEQLEKCARATRSCGLRRRELTGGGGCCCGGGAQGPAARRAQGGAG